VAKAKRQTIDVCRFGRSLKGRRTRVAGAQCLDLLVSFPGNDLILPLSWLRRHAIAVGRRTCKAARPQILK
jgi:hypothetical protein